MFWKKKNDRRPHTSFHQQGNDLAEHLLTAANIDFDASSKLEQALVSTFLFGMLTAEGMMRRLPPNEIRDGAISVFRDVLHYTQDAAIQGVQHCIEATGPNVHEPMKAIIHRGIDGHRQLIEGDKLGLAQSIGDVLQRFQNQR